MSSDELIIYYVDNEQCKLMGRCAGLHNSNVTHAGVIIINNIYEMNKSSLLWVTVILVILDSGGGLFIGIWREWFWDAVSKHDLYHFEEYLAIFIFVALILCVVSSLIGYFSTLYSLKWRAKLTMIGMDTKYNEIEGGEQRIQDDCGAYPTLTVQLSIGMLRAALGILISIYLIMRALHSWTYLVIPILYSVCNTGIAMKIAKPLIQLNYDNQVTEALFRKTITFCNYIKTNKVNLELARKLKHLNYFQSFYNQITVIVPLLILAPAYFSGILTFGLLMQQNASIGALIDNISYFLNSFDSINRWLSCKKRLAELDIV